MRPESDRAEAPWTCFGLYDPRMTGEKAAARLKSMALQLQINGQPRSFQTLHPGDPLASLIAALELKGDRIAVEQNGEIVPRTGWPEAALADGNRVEVVHFVGGGTGCVPGRLFV